MSTSTFLRRLARSLADLRAIRKNRVAERLHNRVAGRALGKITRKVWR